MSPSLVAAMNVTVDRKRAKAIFMEACDEAREHLSHTSHDRTTEEMLRIIGHPRITLRYILLTAILAKATNANVNSLSLQAKDAAPGAYDARSLCHKVIVHTMKSTRSLAFLDKFLGGSKEPFLNQPARCPNITESKTRSGLDTQIRDRIIRLLQNMERMDRSESVAHAGKLLRTIVRHAWSLDFEKRIRRSLDKIRNGALPARHYRASEKHPYQRMHAFLRRVCTETCSGETAVLVVATLESFDASVCADQVNVSDASSSTILDVDVRRIDNTNHCFEIKARDFDDTDVLQAMQKIQHAETTSTTRYLLQFVYHKASMNKSRFLDGVHHVGRGMLKMRSLERYIEDRLFDCAGTQTLKTLYEKMLHSADQIRVRQETRRHLARCY